MPTIPIVPANDSPAPLAVVASNITEAKLIAAYAEWDGTGASGDFLPCLAIYTQAGVRLGRVFPSSPVTAGDEAVVTYAPFPGGISNGLGIHWGRNIDRTNLGLTTFTDNGYSLFDGSTGVPGGGYNFRTWTGGFALVDDGTQDSFLLGGFATGATIRTNSGQILLADQGGFGIHLDSNDAIKIDPATLAFFGVTPVAQQPAPVTLADVIALLQAYGLAA